MKNNFKCFAVRYFTRCLAFLNKWILDLTAKPLKCFAARYFTRYFAFLKQCKRYLTTKSINAGLTLIECALAVLIAGTTVISVLEINANTINTAGTAVDNRLGSLLASEIIAKECFGQFPDTESSATDDVPVGEQEYYTDSKEVDTDVFGMQYKGFSCEVTKFYEDIDVFSQLSDDQQEEEQEESEEETADQATLRIIRIKIVLSYPKQPGEEQAKTLTVETYLRPPTFVSEGTGTN